MATTLRRFTITDNLVQIPLKELQNMLEPNCFRIKINADQIEILDEDEIPLSSEILKKAEETKKLYRKNPEVFTQIVK